MLTSYFTDRHVIKDGRRHRVYCDVEAEATIISKGCQERMRILVHLQTYLVGDNYYLKLEIIQ